MKPTSTASHIRFVFFVMAFALVCAWAQNAHADTQLTIAPSGQVMVRGAVVTGVHGYIITAETTWHSAHLEWTVETTGSTAFVPRIGSADALKAIKAGDTIEFNGVLDNGAEALTVAASSVRDTSLINENAVVNGQVLRVMPESGIFLVDTGSGTTTVAVTLGTILTRAGDTASLSDISVGDTVRAWGVLNLRTSVLSASKASFSVKQVATQQGSGGFFSNIFSWIAGSRGALTVR